MCQECNTYVTKKKTKKYVLWTMQKQNNNSSTFVDIKILLSVYIWNLFTTSHGKSPWDGIGVATIINDQLKPVCNALQMLTTCYRIDNWYDNVRSLLAICFQNAKPIAGTGNYFGCKQMSDNTGEYELEF